MTRQASESANALWTRLQAVFDDTPRTDRVETPAGQSHWPAGFGRDISDVQTVVIHTTDGWPTRDKPSEFVRQYTDPTADKRGIGPHFYLPFDGTVFRLLSENRQCWHGNHTNGWAIGVETGNLTATAAPSGAGGPWPRHWTALSTHEDDGLGARLYAISVNGEILVAWWSARTTAVQADASRAGHVMMLISDAQYRSWALLARYLAEAWRIPRNFPLRPHLQRGDAASRGHFRDYRQIVDADPMRDGLIRTQLLPHYHCTAAIFDSDDPAHGFPHVYAQGVQTSTWTDAHGTHSKQINDVWTRLFNVYRGFHGHGFSGANTYEDHNCPGAWFDWHRFAREVWDYWWYPFDLAQAPPLLTITSNRPRRDYGHADGVLYEHYFDEDPALFAGVTSSGFFPVGDETIAPHPIAAPPGSPPAGPIGLVERMRHRYWGFFHGGMHFQLDAGSPIYALGAGQVVAARLDAPTDGAVDRDGDGSPNPSVRFVLLRHEVYYRRRAGSDRIDYDQEPARVYSLYMHLGRPATVNLDDFADANPTWLNRLLQMKKEYDLGLAFETAHAQPAGQWTPHHTRWQRRQTAIDRVIADLRAGRAALFPEGEDAIRVALGDFVGVAGHLAEHTTGVHLEIFSRDPIDDPWFVRADQGSTRPFHDERSLDDVTSFIDQHVPAPPPATYPLAVYRALPPEQKATKFQKIELRLKSEWALDASDFPSGGFAPNQPLMWWNDVVPAMNSALGTDTSAQLPTDAIVWHYHPLGFLEFINGVTWKSEWPKYKVTDAAGAAVAAPDRPPVRRR